MVRRYPIVAYFALAYLLTWVIQVPVSFFAHHRGVTLGNEDNLSIFVDVLRRDASGDERLAVLGFNIAQFGPFIARPTRWPGKGRIEQRALAAHPQLVAQEA